LTKLSHVQIVFFSSLVDTCYKVQTGVNNTR